MLIWILAIIRTLVTKNNMGKYKKKPLGLFLTAIIVLIFFHYLGFLKFFEKAFLSLTMPIQRNFYNLGSSLGQIVNLNEILAENNKLQEEIAKLSIDYVRLASLEAENEYFRSELNYLNQNNFKYQISNIIGRMPLNEQVVIIDKGNSSGLVPGLAVTVSQGVIVGKVLKVEENRSFVELLTNTQSSLAVGFGSQSGTNGLVIGKAGLNLIMDYIPQNQEITDHEVVITSGLEELIPQGLLVGEVSEITSQVGQIFKQAKVIPPFNYKNLQILTVILKN